MLASVISTFDLDFILPISMVDENMKRAHNRNGLLETKFWWKVPTSADPEETKEAPLIESNFLFSGKNLVDGDEVMSEDEQRNEDASRYRELYIW